MCLLHHAVSPFQRWRVVVTLTLACVAAPVLAASTVRFSSR